MKMSRDQLKSIVRQLMIEILSEGLGNVASVPTPRTNIRERSLNRKPTPGNRLDVQLPGGRVPTAALKETIAAEARGNPILADILADTAVTTLPAQLSQGDSMGPGGAVGPQNVLQSMPQTEQFTGDPADVFGSGGQAREDGMSYWADLAFMPAKKSA